jgi:hypothetical protein
MTPVFTSGRNNFGKILSVSTRRRRFPEKVSAGSPFLSGRSASSIIYRNVEK